MDNQEQLKKLAKVFNADKIVTTEDISEVLKGVLGIMNNFKRENQALTTETKQAVDNLLGRVMEERSQLVSDASYAKTKEEFEGKIQQVQEFLKEVKKIKKTPGRDGIDGMPADEEKIVAEVLKKIPKIYTINTFEDAPKNAIIGDIIIVKDTEETFIYE